MNHSQNMSIIIKKHLYLSYNIRMRGKRKEHNLELPKVAILLPIVTFLKSAN